MNKPRTELKKEFDEIKKELFGDSKFATVDDNPLWKRYDELFNFFHPEFKKNHEEFVKFSEKQI